MGNSKLSVFFYLLLVFVSGIGVGVIGYRGLNPPPHYTPPDERRRQLIEETTREVKLTQDQVLKLEQIYDDTSKRFTDIRDGVQKDMHEKVQEVRDEQIAQIKAFLSPEQIILYDKLRAKREAEREAKDKQKGRHQGAPPGVKRDK